MFWRSNNVKNDRDNDSKEGLTRSGKVFRHKSHVKFFMGLIRGNYQEVTQNERPLSEKIAKESQLDEEYSKFEEEGEGRAKEPH